MMRNLPTIFILLSASLAHGGQSEMSPIPDPALFQALQYRLAGPSRGGRVTAVSGVADQPLTFYMGSTGGGVWKTTDAGTSWKNISDGFFKAGSIGAIAVAESDSNVVYAGTGSACPRGNVSIGVGLYRSTDAGQSWQHIGLDKGGLIGRIVVHPHDPELVYVAVLGNIFGRNPERGVFRSHNGGQHWEKVLFVSDGTGAIDLVMDAQNPRILYAGMWRAERKPWTLIDGGDEGGVFKTSDGGENWERLEGGLPSGTLGRIGVAVSPADSSRVWVLIETTEEETGGLYRSEDAGQSWERINRNHTLRSRAWYYNHVFADPIDTNTVYVLNAGFHKSIDGGLSFERVRVPHGDNHGLWINPTDPNILINSNDGGANVSFNGGQTWSTQLNQPTAEFYRVAVDNQFPYRLYGAQQDNTTISVPSRSAGGITPMQHWYAVGGGESGHIAVDPRDPNIIYAGNYIGQITRLDRGQNHVRDIVAYPQMHDGIAGRDIRYRYQWNAPIRISPHDPNTLYHTSQYVHRSRDEGQSWTVISPDLTTDNDSYQDIPGGPIQHDHTGVELYTTIFAFEESPHEAGILWTGSDDGLVYLSRDGGENWKDVTPAQMPAGGTVNMIELSAHGPGRAFLAIYKYRENDFRPYLFRTDNYGSSWALLTNGTNGIQPDHFVRVVREDPDRQGLLYAGTEFGMYISFDDGGHWQPFQLNLPVTPITDLTVHSQDLVVATQGRSFWILDDITPLHSLSGELIDVGLHLFPPRTAFRTREGSVPTEQLESAPQGAIFYYSLGEEEGPPIQLEIEDATGRAVRAFSSTSNEESKSPTLSTTKGLNRFVWDLTYPGADIIEGSIFSLSSPQEGPHAPPGSYRVRLSRGEHTREHTLIIQKDPRWRASAEDLQGQLDLALQVRDQLNAAHSSIRTIRDVRDQVQAIAKRAVEAGHNKAVQSAADALSDKLGAVEEDLIQTRSETRQDPINYPSKIDDQLAYLFDIVKSQDARPTEGSYQRFEDLKNELATHLETLRSLLEKELPGFQNLLKKENVGTIVVP